MKPNALYCGDNLEIMAKLPEESIDLIYIDPPFFSSRTYEVIFGDTREVRAFEDRWKGGLYHYVNWMETRLAQMHRLLKPTGSIYVHLDWHAVHYLKVSMDKIFGYDNFQNEVIWYYRGGGVSKHRYGRRHDNILFYTKGKRGNFNPDAVRVSYSPETKERLRYKARAFRGDRVYDTYEANPLGKHPDDVWEMQPIMPSAKERLGYPTQKPERLLRRIVLASSKEGDIVADFFCGCGTTLAVAQQLDRRWVGCDVSPTALRVVKQRLEKLGATNIEMVNFPMELAELKAMKPFEFQNYVIDFIQGAHSARLSGDYGVDGYTLFHRYPIQVKQNEHVGRPDIQKFASAIRKERKQKGYVFGLGFSKPAHDEVARLKLEEGMDIELWEVPQLVKTEPPPSFL